MLKPFLTHRQYENGGPAWIWPMNYGLPASNLGDSREKGRQGVCSWFSNWGDYPRMFFHQTDPEKQLLPNMFILMVLPIAKTKKPQTQTQTKQQQQQQQNSGIIHCA